MDQTTSHAEGAKKVAERIKGIRFAMITTTGADGTLRSRPMTTQEQEFDGDLWFFTAKDAPIAQDVRYNAQVNAAYAHPQKDDWVSVSGEASLVDDDAKKRELWNDGLKAWFPDGLEDPELVLLRIRATGAEYWDGAGRITTLLGMARAAVTGKPATNMGDKGKVEL